MEFYVGQRVEIHDVPPIRLPGFVVGLVGTVMVVVTDTTWSGSVGVIFDDWFGGHDLSGHVKDSRSGYFFYPVELCGKYGYSPSMACLQPLLDILDNSMEI